MGKIGNWVGELSTTTGTGAITFGGAIQGYAAWSTIGNGEVWYGITDGLNREVGLGTLNGIVLTRTTVYATLIGGVYNANSPNAISLSGAAEIYSSFNKAAFDEHDQKIDPAGGTMAGQLKGILPVSAEDLTRKDYVDLQVSNLEAGAVSTNAANIATNTSNIASNASDISTNVSNISSNNSNIATNASNIATNTGNISTNTNDIAANTSNISTNTNDIATNTNDITTNDADIAANALAITLVGDIASIPARNTVLNQDPVSQGTSTRSGMSSTLYTGNGAARSIATGVDMDTGDFGGLVWAKSRSAANSWHQFVDTVRGPDKYLFSNDTRIDFTTTDRLTAFTSSGFDLGADASNDINGNGRTFVAWSWQTTKKSIFNFLRYSQEFNNAVWTKVASTVVTGNEVAPDGSLTAFKIDDISTSSAGAIIQSFSAQDLVYTISYYIKRGTSNQCSISFTAPNFPFQTVGFNFDTETLSGNSVADAAFTEEGNGWYRISLKMSSSSGLGNVGTRIYATDSDLGNTRTGSVIAWGAQVVEGATPQGYVQTVDSQGATTNRGKPYTCHYNADLGFSIVGYEGDGVDGHEIPHFLGKKPELTIFKSRDTSGIWVVQSSLFEYTEFLVLNTTAALGLQSAVNTLFSDTTVTIGTNPNYNTVNDSLVQYNFTSIPNVCKIDRYKGTGAAGNYVDCGFKVGWLLVKNLTSVADWMIVDASRAGFRLFPNLADPDTLDTSISFVDDGFVLTSSFITNNALNSEYIFMAYAEGTAFDGTKTLTNYPYATTDEVLTINEGTLMSFAEGFNAIGQANTQELVGAGVTLSFGAGYEEQTRYVYKDKGTTFDSTEYRNLEGISRAQADKFGLVSPLDAATRTTDKHFGYESATGVVIESGNDGTGFGYQAFNKTVSLAATSGFASYRWRTTSTTTSYLGYKYNEPRVLKSWRFQENVQNRSPKRFTIEGSNNGYTWTAIDSTYTASDYTGNGEYLWGDIQDTAANTTAYVYHRINITANNGDANQTIINELEFNTITPSDYYNVVDGLVYNNAGTVIDRVYLAKIMTGASGELLNYENLPVAKIKSVDQELQGNSTVHGEIKNRGICTAWVNFDGTTNPPTIRDSENVADVVDLGTGQYEIIFETPMDDIGFSLGVSKQNNSTQTNTNAYEIIFQRTTNKIRIVCHENSSLTDSPNVGVQVFGGKEIL
jgi:hypothetical protein